MAIKRDSLRAQRDFYSPMTGNTGTEIRYAAAPTQTQSKYGSQVKERLSEIGQNTRRSAPIIKAIKTAMKKTDDPFTQVGQQKSYAPQQEENQIGAQIEGIASAAQDAVSEGVAQAETAVESYRKSSNQKAAERRAQRQQERQADLKAAREERKAAADERAALRGDMKKLFERDRRMYGNTVPKGSMGSGSKPGPAVDTRTRHSVGGPEAQPTISKFQKPETAPVKTRTYGGQGSSVNKLGATTIRQGGAVKDGKYVGKQERGPAVNVSGSAEANREKQRNLRMAQAQQSRLTAAVKATNTPTGLGLKAGSFGISQAGKDQAAINRGIAAAKATGIPSQTAVQGGAMSQAARDQAAINKGIKAAEATGIPSGDALKAGSFGISEAGRAEAAKNKAMAKAKAQAATKTSTVSTTTKQGVQRTKAQMAAAKRKASGTSMGAAKAANKASMKAKAAARHASFKKAKAAGTHARTASAQRARNKAAAKARAKAAAKRRRSKKGKKGKKCDISLKYDISLLTNNNLRHDELADVAYFVRALREVEL